jgi:hypothetical protein
VQTISADRVVLARPEGPVDIRLHDPSKPRPPAPPALQPGIPGQPTLPRPGVAVPQAVDPSGQPQAVAPGVPQPGTPLSPGDQGGVARRPLPPNLLRRLPPGTVPPANVSPR